MAKQKTVYVCKNCGNDAPKWFGKCSACGEWNTCIEEVERKESKSSQRIVGIERPPQKPILLHKIETTQEQRIDMHNEELNRVLGVQIADITSELAKEKGLKTLDGVYIHSVVENGAADNAGLKSEDIIQQINGIRVNTVAQLQEQLSRFRPGDQVTIQVLRKNKELSMRATLKNKLGNTDVVSSQVNAEEYLSIRVKEIDNQTKSQLRLSYGLQITEIKKGKLFDQGIKNNYIIVSVNNQAIRTKDDLQQALDTALHAADRNKVLFVTGVYPNGVRAYYAINLDE